MAMSWCSTKKIKKFFTPHCRRFFFRKFSFDSNSTNKFHSSPALNFFPIPSNYIQFLSEENFLKFFCQSIHRVQVRVNFLSTLCLWFSVFDALIHCIASIFFRVNTTISAISILNWLFRWNAVSDNFFQLTFLSDTKFFPKFFTSSELYHKKFLKAEKTAFLIKIFLRIKLSKKLEWLIWKKFLKMRCSAIWIWKIV